MRLFPLLLTASALIIATQAQETVEVNFLDNDLEVEEGEQFNVRIAKAGINEEAFVVIVEVENDNDDDFVGSTQVARFEPRSPGITSVKFTVKDDDIPESAKIHYLRLYVLDSRILTGAKSRMAVTIKANDDAYGVFSLDEVAPLIVTERDYTSVSKVTVKRDVSDLGAITVFFMVNSSDTNALLNEDILPATGSVIFQAQQNEAEIELQIRADNAPEMDERFFVTLTSATNNARVVKEMLELVIAANDAPVRFFTNEYRLDEGPGTRTFNVEVTRGLQGDGVTIIGPVDKEVSVQYSFSMDGDSALNGKGFDYAGTDGTLTFSAGETKKTISFELVDDSIPEIEEFFSIRLTRLEGDAVIISPSVATVVINANDNPSGIISFQSNTDGGDPFVQVNEDSFASVEFKVERSEGTFGEVSVRWRISSDTGLAPVTEDVGPREGTLYFSDGEREEVIALTVVQDNTPEDAELFYINLIAASITGEARVEGFTTAKLLIEDSDDVYGTVEFGPGSDHKLIISRTPRQLQFSVTRSGGRRLNLEVNVTVSYDDGTHKLDIDDVLAQSSQTVTLPAGQDPVTVTFELLPSTFLVVGGEFKAYITGLGFEQEPNFGSFNSPKLGFRKQTSVLVSAVEANGETGFFNVSNQIVDEPETGVIQVGLLVSREGSNGRAVIRWSVSGNQVTTEDIVVMSGTIVLESGMSEKLLNIGIKADDIPEVAEFVEVKLDSIEPSDSQRLRQGSSSVIITVNSNDNPGGVLQFSPNMNDSYEVLEGGDAIEIIVERMGGDLVQQQVQYSIVPDGTKEFFGATNILVFPPGSREVTARILARRDGIPEIEESYRLILTNAGNPPSVLGARTSVNITIASNDNPNGVIQFYKDPTIEYTGEGQMEEQLTINILVVRGGGTFGMVTVSWSITPSPQADLSPSSGILVFDPDQAEQNISLTVINDDIPEQDETFAVQLSNPDGGAIAGIPNVATVIVMENDNPVVFTEPLLYVNEPATLNLVVRRQGRLNKEVQVRYRTLDGSASHLEKDYRHISTRELVFGIGEQEKQIEISVLEDDMPEGNETFSVQLFDATGDLIVTNSSTTTIVILANDGAYGSFNFSQPAEAEVEEGSRVFFDIVRHQGTFGFVRVYWELRTTNNFLLTPGEDFQVTSDHMDFAPQESRKPLGITPIADNVPETGEQYLLILTQVEVLSGMASENLASLGSTGTVATLQVLSSDDPYGRMAFGVDARDLMVAEDINPGNENSTRATFTIERRQGTKDAIQVLWEIFSDRLGGNLPPVHDLLFSGQWPLTMARTATKRRPGTQTPVALFSGSPDQFITVPSDQELPLSSVTDGFSLSSWVQPFTNGDGYLVAYCTEEGNTHYFSVRLKNMQSTTTVTVQLSTEAESNQQMAFETSTIIDNSQWHHILVSVGNTSVTVYVDGQTIGVRLFVFSPILEGPGLFLVGAQPPGSDLYVGYLQDVRIFMRAFEDSAVTELYLMTPFQDVTPISGILTYNGGVRSQRFTTASKQDIEEEGREVFAVILLDTTGGATLSSTDSRTTLSVLKSDNANGLFGFEQACSPSRILYENTTITCTVQRARGDDGTVIVSWIVNQKQGKATQEATSDFDESSGEIVFLPGERSKTFQIQVTEETVPEIEELFEVRLTSVMSDDGLSGSTNTSGASLESTKQTSDFVIEKNDYPYGLLQFSEQLGVVPEKGPLITPVNHIVRINVSEEDGLIPLVVQRAQGTLGTISAEFRTKDVTALSEGKSPPDYVGGVGSITMMPNENYAFINITVNDNAIPETEKTFEVELLNPTGGAALGIGSKASVSIEASDGAFGLFQFADTSLSVSGTEDGDGSSNTINLQVVRLAGVLGTVNISWKVLEDQDDGLDIINQSGMLNILAGQSSAVLGIQVRGDTDPELDETVRVILTQAVGGDLGNSLKTTATVTIAANDDPYGRFIIDSSFRPKLVTETEQDVTVRIQRQWGSFGSVDVSYVTLDPSEIYPFLPGPVARASTADFVPTQGTVSFQAGQTVAEFTVSILDDQLPEQEESVFIRLSDVKLTQGAQINSVSLSPRLGQNSQTYAQLIISSNDDASGRLELSPSSLTVSESDPNLAVNVIRTGGTFGEVSVGFRVVSGTAQLNYDFTVLSSIVILASGETSKPVPVNLIDDRVPELSETFSIELETRVTGGAVLGTQRRSEVTIMPSDDPNGVFGFVSQGQSVEERAQSYPIEITIARTGGSIDVVTVTWEATLNGQPATGDVNPISGSLFFVTNEASRKITLMVLPDDIPEGLETINIRLINATNGGRIGDSDIYLLTIAPNDNPHGTVELSSAAFSVPENPADGLQTGQVIRSGGTYGRLQVYYSTSAMTLVDIASINGGNIYELFSKPFKGIPTPQGNEVNVSQSNNTLESCASACLLESSCSSFVHHETENRAECLWYTTIFEQGSLLLINNSYYYIKDNRKVSQLMVSIATRGADFSVVTRQSVFIADGQSSALIPLPVINDQVPELEERFYLKLVDVEVADTSIASSAPPLLGQLLEASVVITTNDNAFGVFRIYSQSAGVESRIIEVNETNRLAVDFVVEREGGSIGTVSVEWSISLANRTATNGLDYIADGATLIFDVEQTRRVLTLTILDDTIPEDDEELTIILSNPRGGSTLSNMDSIKVIILANDNVAGVLSFQRTSVLVNEGEQIDIVAIRSSPAMGTVTMDWVIEGLNKQVANQGFAQNQGTLTFLPLETEKTISLNVLSDDEPEINEEYSLTLQNIMTQGVGMTGAASLDPQRGKVLVTIAASNNPHGIFQLAQASLSLRVSENVGTANLLVDRKFGDIGVVRVSYEVVEGSLTPFGTQRSPANAGQDFVAVTSGFIDIDDGVASGNIGITIIDDAIPEIDEVFVVRLTGVSLIDPTSTTLPPTLSSNSSQTEVVITANDGAQGIIHFAPDSRSVPVTEQGQTISLTVLRGNGTFGQVSVFFYSQAVTETAVQGQDYNMTAGELVFEEGESRETIELTILDDDIPEPAESFEVILAQPSNGAILGQNIRATVIISSSDESGGRISFDTGDIIQMKEPTPRNPSGSQVEILVRRGPGVYGEVSVTYRIESALGQLTNDFSPQTGTLIFKDRELTKSLRLEVVDDDQPETAENFTLTLQAPSGGAILGEINTRTITVAASDAPYGLLQLFTENSGLSNYTIEETFGVWGLEVVRSQGIQGQVSVDVITVPGTATSVVDMSNVVLAPMTDVNGAAVSAWHQVTVGDTVFLVMLTSLTSDTQLASLLPSSSTVGVGQSVLYKWQGEPIYAQTFSSDGAKAATSFSINGNTYLVVANSGREGTREVSTLVYRLTPKGEMVVVQGLATSGARDAAYFSRDSRHFLFVANSMGDSSRSDISSHVYEWNSGLGRFNSSPFQLVATLYASAVISFTIDGQVYVTVGNFYDSTTGSYQTSSVVYSLASDFTLVQHQQIITQGVVSITYTQAGSMDLLVFGNNRQDIISTPQDSSVYRWDSTVRQFIFHQTLQTSRVESVRSVTMEEGSVLIVFANSVGNSEIFIWDLETSFFKSVWKGSPYFSLQPITIRQDLNVINMLASANVNRQENPTLFQIAQVAEGSDFVPRRVTMTFEPGQTTLRTSVVTLTDETPEDNESFSVSLIYPSGGAELGQQISVKVQILPNDDAYGVIEFSKDSLTKTAEEKDNADSTVQLNVVRKLGFFGFVSVAWQATGDQSGVGDITPLAGQVEFQNGQSEATIILTIRDDQEAEFAEVTYIRLTEVVEGGTNLISKGAKLGENNVAVLTVLASDSPYGVVAWEKSQVSVVEPENTDMSIDLAIIRQQGLEQAIRVNYVTSSATQIPKSMQATSGEDFVATQGFVSMAEGVAKVVIRVVIKQDSIPESSEIFLVNLTSVNFQNPPPGSGSTGPSIAIGQGVMEVTITENDNARGTIELDVETNLEGVIDVYEDYGKNTTIELPLKRLVGFFGSITVTWQATPIKADVRDYFPSSGTVQFGDQQKNAVIIITIIDDTIPEDKETFEVKLISASAGAGLGTNSVQVAILKNDSPTGFFKFATPEVETRESVNTTDPGGQARLLVQRVQGFQGLVNVKWRLSAEAESDFMPPQWGTIQFLQGEQEKAIVLQTRPDTVLEGREEFVVSLVAADNNGDISPTDGDSMVIILPDAGSSGTISILPESRSLLVGEPGESSPSYSGEVEIKLTRGLGIFGEVIITWSLTPRDLSAFLQVEGSLRFLDLQQTASIVLLTRDDSIPELRQRFTLQINSASGGAVVSPVSGEYTADIVYAASDFPHGLVQFLPPEVLVVSEDDDEVLITVSRSKGLKGQLRVAYTTVAGGATDYSDFLPSAGTLTFQPEVNSQVIDLRIVPDEISEGPEDFFVNLTSVQLVNDNNDYSLINGISRDMKPGLGSFQTKIVRIDKNDNAEGIVEFSQRTYEVKEESGMATLSVIRNKGQYGQISVQFSTVMVTAVEGVDFVAASGQLILDDGVGNVTLNISLKDDSEREQQETFNIELSNVLGGAHLGNISTATVVILKSDYPNGRFAFQDPLIISVANPEQMLPLSLFVERTGGLLGQQQVFWRIMGPNNPRLQLQDTSDISSLIDGREVTSNFLTWADGESGVKQVRLDIKGHTSWEIAKTFMVELYRVSGSPGGIGDGEVDENWGITTIKVERFGEPNGVVRFTGEATLERQVLEPGSISSVSMVFPVARRTGTGSTGNIQIFWEVRPVTREGANDNDIQPFKGSLPLEEGRREGEIILQILPDEVPELTEVFSLVLMRIEGGAQIDSQFNQSIFSIRYNDFPHGEFAVLPELQAIEVNAADLTRQIRLNFTRFQGTFGAVLLTYTIGYDVSGTGVSLDKSTATVTFNSGEDYSIDLIIIRGNGFLKLGSTFTVCVTDVQFLGDGVTEPPTIRTGFSKAQIAVPDMAANTELSFSSDTAFVNEGDRTLTVKLVRSGLYGNLAVGWASGYSNAELPTNVVNGEITPKTGIVDMSHGQEEANLTVQVHPLFNRTEAFVLRLTGSLQTFVSGGAKLASSHLMVQADPSGVIQFSETSLAAQASELEGQVTLTVWRLYGSEGRVALYYQTMPDTAESDLDYQKITNGILTMDHQQTIATLSIQIYHDSIPEQDEHFYVNLTNVEKLPTPTQPVKSPRLSRLKSLSHVLVRKNYDPYGILYLEPSQTDVQESFRAVTLTVMRAAGSFGAVSVTVRTVGGGEVWTSEIAPRPDSLTNDTIADVIGKRRKQEVANSGIDYEMLNTAVQFEDAETSKNVTVTILEDTKAEPMESVLIYLTQPIGGARIAAGTSDNGLKGFALITIAASDLSNGLIGFAESSKNVRVNEDISSPRAILKLTRLNAFFGSVTVYWIAKKSSTSTAQEDADLGSQLVRVAGSTVCPADQSECDLQVDLIDDQDPEESFTFVVILTDAGTDAKLNENNLIASVTILASDDIKGLIQFTSDSREIIAGENDRTVRLAIERIKGQAYEVTVTYSTTQMLQSIFVSGVNVYPALEAQDFRGQIGSLTFLPNDQRIQYIDLTLTPVLASDNPLPKQFYIKLSSPTNSARVSEQMGEAVVRIVSQANIPIWEVVNNLGENPFSDDNTILQVVGELDNLAQNYLTKNNMDLMENVLNKINEQGEERSLPDKVVTAVGNLYCKLLNEDREDARRGRNSLAQVLEEFSYTMLEDEPCPPLSSESLKSTQCVNVKISAGRWTPAQLMGHTFEVQTRNTFMAPRSLPTTNTRNDWTDDECLDFSLLEYNSQMWFTKKDDTGVMQSQVIGFNIKGHPSGRTQNAVKFKIHTPDRRTAARGAECVIFDEGLERWINPSDACDVTSDPDDSFVECECRHMSSYAVKAKTRDSDIVGYTVWFYVVCFICLSSVMITVAVHHLCFTRATFSASIHMHFLSAIFFTQLCLVLDAFLSDDSILAYDSSDDNSKCIVVGLFLHYFFIAQFTWIATQSVNLWKVLVMNDEHTDRHYIVFFVIGWGVPLVLVAIFYAVSFNIFKYHTNLDVDHIYGDVNDNGEICFITNGYTALGGILLPVLFSLLVVGVVFVRAQQISSQWQLYDDVYRGRFNSKEIPLMLLIWALLLLAMLWIALHMIYGYLWMMVLFCICDLTLAMVVFVSYAVIRNPLLSCLFGPIKSTYSVTGDLSAFPPPSEQFNPYPTVASIKGSKTSLLNDAWENNTAGGRSRMTVRRALPSQVYINPPVAVVSPAATLDSDNPDFDDLIYALKMGRSLTPSELSRSFDDDMSQLSVVLDRYETKRIDIADTHL